MPGQYLGCFEGAVILVQEVHGIPRRSSAAPPVWRVVCHGIWRREGGSEIFCPDLPSSRARRSANEHRLNSQTHPKAAIHTQKSVDRMTDLGPVPVS